MKKLNIFNYLIISTILFSNKQSAKSIEIKFDPISALYNTLKVGFEKGYKNVGFGLDVEILFKSECSNNLRNSSMIDFINLMFYNPVKDSIEEHIVLESFNKSLYKGSYCLNFNLNYYLKDSRNGFSLINRLIFESIKRIKDENNDEFERYSCIYIRTGIEHKIKVNDFFSITNSIELPIIIYNNLLKTKFEKFESSKEKDVNEEKFKRFKEKFYNENYRESRILSNLRLNFMEFRFTF